MLNRTIGVFVITSLVWLGTPAIVFSAEFDFNAVLVCKPDYLQVCENNDLTCDRVEVVHIDGVQTLRMDPIKILLTAFIGKEKTSISKIDVS